MNPAPAQGHLFGDPTDTEHRATAPVSAVPETSAAADTRIVTTRSPDKTDPRRGLLLLAVVVCPFCEHQHIHPAGRVGQPRLGVRRSRCIGGRTGGLYELGRP